MKVGILTQPLEENYGGILQAYALQQVLMSLGVDSEIINRVDDSAYNRSLYLRCKHFLGRVYRYPLHGNFRRLFRPYYMEQWVRNRLFCHTYSFTRRYLQTSPRLNSEEAFLRYVSEHTFEGFVVGSDQVWRPRYSPNIYTYFLDFCIGQSELKRISYAASFGVDDWEFSDEDTRRCSVLLSLFDAVSVREDSAVALCSRYLNRPDAIQVLDPTLLLEAVDYIRGLSISVVPKSPSSFITYVLDKTDDKQKVIDTVSLLIDQQPHSVLAPYSYFDDNCPPLSQCVQPPIEDWIRAFYDSSFAVVDSFHGCAFSIIFNVPFIVLANPDRGLSRIRSLLKLFELEDRLIFSDDDFHVGLVTTPIDWDKVNRIRQVQKCNSIRFLTTSLGL